MIKAHETTGEQATYTCPMHPEVRSAEPGKCPKCGMFLVLEETGESEDSSAQAHTSGCCGGHSHEARDNGAAMEGGSGCCGGHAQENTPA